jgi:uroporphyrinogen decarboxylase
MNSRERFQLCMQHRCPDRPPLDLGATSLTGMRPGCQKRLAELLGFRGPARPSNSGVDERILEWAGTDFRSVGAILDLPSPHTRQVSETCAIDCWGIERQKIYGEWQITRSPLKGATRQDLDQFAWPAARLGEALLQKWELEAQRLQQDGRYVVIAEHPVYGILELGCWMCGYDDFMMKMAADTDFVRAFFDIVLAIQMQVIEAYYGVLGPYLHLTTSGDDFGTQRGSFVSPAMFAGLIAPYFEARIARTKQLANCYYWHHTCGAVARLLPQIIACGVELLNPVQTSAAGMDPEGLKAAYGDSLVFWGAVDVQQLLPRATPNEVRQEVRRLIKVLGRDGGYVSAPAHEMQDDIPPENIVAWVETVRENMTADNPR